MSWTSPKPFHAAALAAFPYACKQMAAEAAELLAPTVDDSYQKRSTRIELKGEGLYIPHRFHFSGFESEPASLPIAARFLLTRATDGHLRQRALRTVLEHKDPPVAPFVALLAADYVVEIAEEIRGAISRFHRPAYAEFALENRALMRVLRERAISYWDCYYRADFPDRRDYPGLAVLQEIEAWAS